MAKKIEINENWEPVEIEDLDNLFVVIFKQGSFDQGYVEAFDTDDALMQSAYDSLAKQYGDCGCDELTKIYLIKVPNTDQTVNMCNTGLFNGNCCDPHVIEATRDLFNRADCEQLSCWEGCGLTEAKKKKKPYSSAYCGFTDPELNIKHFNKCMGTDGLQNPNSQPLIVGDVLPDAPVADTGSSEGASTAGSSAGEGGEGGAVGESLNEDTTKELQIQNNENIEKDIEELEPPIEPEYFPNNMGINLSSVKKETWVQQDDGQLKSIEIEFDPATDGEKESNPEASVEEQASDLDEAVAGSDWVKISTGLTGEEDKAILDSLLGQLSDGLWENSPRMEKYWKNLSVELDGADVVIRAPSYYKQLFDWDSEQDVRKFFATHLKHLVKQIIQWYPSEPIEWSRDCDYKFTGFFHKPEPRVKDVYRVYDKLLGRRDRITKEGIEEDMNLKEDSIYSPKFGATIELPPEVKIIPKDQLEKAVELLEPEEEFEVGYITPVYFYGELVEHFTLLKSTVLIGYTGIDYIEARADDEANKERRIQRAKDTTALGTQRGVHLDRRPRAHKLGDFSANYASTNKTVLQNEGNTLLFYPRVGSVPVVKYYLDIHDGKGFFPVKREILERTILKRVDEIADELLTGVKKDGTLRKRRWSDVDLGNKIKKQLAQDAATIEARTLDAETSSETRSAISNGPVSKPQVRALYTHQIFYYKSKDVTLGKNINESLTNLTEAKRYVKRYYIRPQNIFCSNKEEILKALVQVGDENCSVYSLKSLADHDDVHLLKPSDIIYYYDEGVLYDKNHVKVMDYDLFVKHEEERKKVGNVDAISDAAFGDIYDDRATKDDLKDKEVIANYKALNKITR